MTRLLPDGHPNRAFAQRFGKELRRARAQRGFSRAEVSRQVGIGPSALWYYERGENLPQLENAQRLSAALGAPVLIEIVIESRTGACVECGRAFTHRNGRNRRYCSSVCQSVAQKLREAKGTTRQRAVSAERQRDLLTSLIEQMCRTCEPEGLCRDEECPLRQASPLPMARTTDDTMPMQPALQGHAKRWADPEERARQAARFREMWHGRTDEERAAWAQRSRESRWKKVA